MALVRNSQLKIQISLLSIKVGFDFRPCVYSRKVVTMKCYNELVMIDFKHI